MRTTKSMTDDYDWVQHEAIYYKMHACSDAIRVFYKLGVITHSDYEILQWLNMI